MAQGARGGHRHGAARSGSLSAPPPPRPRLPQAAAPARGATTPSGDGADASRPFPFPSPPLTRPLSSTWGAPHSKNNSFLLLLLVFV
eukprot:scaffold94607_cov27-Tisochrysis_lutea.AAC.5